ncbi:MAG: hypothetical protein ACQEWM_12845 [Actinomycetota bacterium]
MFAAIVVMLAVLLPAHASVIDAMPEVGSALAQQSSSLIASESTDAAAAPSAAASSEPSEPESTDAPGVDPGTDSFGALPSVAVFVLAGLAVLAFIAYRLNRRRKHIDEA